MRQFKNKTSKNKKFDKHREVIYSVKYLFGRSYFLCVDFWILPKEGKEDADYESEDNHGLYRVQTAQL